MAISTDKLIPGVLPPKEEQKGVDFVQILDSIDPSALSADVLDAFARRDPWVTDPNFHIGYYRYEDVLYKIPGEPVVTRLRIGRFSMENDRKDLIEKVEKLKAGAPNAYKNCRAALIRAIGSKVCAYIVEQEFNALTEEQRIEQKLDYERWKRCNSDNREWLSDPDDSWYYGMPASVSEKIIKVRKGVRKSDGRFFTQRDFAKLIGYPIAAYASTEKDEEYVTDELLEKLIMICHANPYFLYDFECEASFAEYGGESVANGDAPSVFADYGTIYKWITEGKPRNVSWIDAFAE